jgi:hypothetical protein
MVLDDLAVYLRGPVLGFILRLRGATALHSSAVCINGKAVALCGTSASGKSTTAAALSLRGIPVLSDDIVAITEGQNGAFCAEPGHPHICLWPNSVEHLLGYEDALPRLVSSWDKRYLPLDGVRAHFEAARRPLSLIYVLAPRAGCAYAPRIEPLGKREALLALVQNTYMNWLLDRQQRAAEFEMLSKVVDHIQVRRVVPHVDPARLNGLCDLIVHDASQICPPARRLESANINLMQFT